MLRAISTLGLALALFASTACTAAMAVPARGDGGTNADGADDSGVPYDWAVLTWDAPTTNTDGSPLTDLGGYFVYHGMIDPIEATNSTKLDVGDVTTYTFKNLAVGTHYFAVSTYNTEGVESAFSVTAEKTVP